MLAEKVGNHGYINGVQSGAPAIQKHILLSAEQCSRHERVNNSKRNNKYFDSWD